MKNENRAEKPCQMLRGMAANALNITADAWIMIEIGAAARLPHISQIKAAQ
ncbi:MAG: hypothetical protein WCY71_03850 [Halothiobacillaceae bacterium]